MPTNCGHQKQLNNSHLHIYFPFAPVGKSPNLAKRPNVIGQNNKANPQLPQSSLVVIGSSWGQLP
jgi:hypothetical protein